MDGGGGKNIDNHSYNISLGSISKAMVGLKNKIENAVKDFKFKDLPIVKGQLQKSAAKKNEQYDGSKTMLTKLFDNPGRGEYDGVAKMMSQMQKANPTRYDQELSELDKQRREYVKNKEKFNQVDSQSLSKPQASQQATSSKINYPEEQRLTRTDRTTQASSSPATTGQQLMDSINWAKENAPLTNIGRTTTVFVKGEEYRFRANANGVGIQKQIDFKEGKKEVGVYIPTNPYPESDKFRSIDGRPQTTEADFLHNLQANDTYKEVINEVIKQLQSNR